MRGGGRQFAMAGISLLLAGGAGCAFFGLKSEEPLLPAESLFLTLEDLEARHLQDLPLLFGEEEAPVVERLGASDARVLKDYLGGRFFLNSQASLLVRLFRNKKSLLAGLNSFLGEIYRPYRLGKPTPLFKLSWWYREGPPAEIIFTYGNALVVIRSDELAPHQIPTEGLRIARQVAARLRSAQVPQ